METRSVVPREPIPTVCEASQSKRRCGAVRLVHVDVASREAAYVARQWSSSSGQECQSVDAPRPAKESASVEPIPAPPMTLRQAAGYLGVGENVLRTLCRQGRVHAFKAGGQWRILPQDLTNYILKQLQKS